MNDTSQAQAQTPQAQPTTTTTTTADREQRERERERQYRLDTITSATPHYRVAAAAEFQAQKFLRESHQHQFWWHVALRAAERGYAIERAYREQEAAKRTQVSGYGWAGMFM